jgi:hypothetical protein
VVQGYSDRLLVIAYGFCLLLPLAFAGLGYILYRLVLKLMRGRTTRFWTVWTYLALLLCLYWSPIVPYQQIHCSGFYYWAKSHVDIPLALIWVENYKLPPDKTADESYWRIDLPSEALPPLIDGRPIRIGRERSEVTFARYYREKKTLELTLGTGHLGNWGITIGRGVGTSKGGYRINDDAYVWYSGGE